MSRRTAPEFDAPRPAAPESAGHPARPGLALGALLLAVAGCSDCGSCGSPPPPPATEISLGLVAGDFGGSSLASIVATSTVVNGQINPGNLKTYLWIAPDQYADPAYLAAGNDPLYLASADLNGDKLSDVVSASDNDGTLSVFLNNPKSPGQFNSPIVLTSPGASQLAIADVNGDGLNDLVITDPGPAGGAAPTVSVLLQDHAHPRQFLAPVSYAIAANSDAQSIVVAPLGGKLLPDLPDIVIGGSSAVSVLLHNAAGAAGTFLAAANYAVTSANEIAVADVNGDGLADILVGTGPNSSTANGVTTISPGVLLQIASAPGTFSAVQDIHQLLP